MIGRLTTAVEFAGEEASPWGALKLIAGTANAELAGRISEKLERMPELIDRLYKRLS